eukprot:scaffold1607_cov417-Prasinococcus_capsulatus_cf.AAC.3
MRLPITLTSCPQAVLPAGRRAGGRLGLDCCGQPEGPTCGSMDRVGGRRRLKWLPGAACRGSTVSARLPLRSA